MNDLGHNNPPSPAEQFEAQIGSIIEQSNELVAFGVTAENAAKARDIIGLSVQLAKEIDQTRKVEKQPHLDAGREIDSTYNPLRDRAQSSVADLKRELTRYLAEEKRKADEARREAERKAEEERKAAEALKAEDDAFAESAERRAREADAEARLVAAETQSAGSVKGEMGMRAASLRVRRFAVVNDYRALVSHYADHAAVKELVEKLANADIRAAKGGPVSIPGVTVDEEEVLA